MNAASGGDAMDEVEEQELARTTPSSSSSSSEFCYLLESSYNTNQKKLTTLHLCTSPKNNAEAGKLWYHQSGFPSPSLHHSGEKSYMVSVTFHQQPQCVYQGVTWSNQTHNENYKTVGTVMEWMNPLTVGRKSYSSIYYHSERSSYGSLAKGRNSKTERR